MAQTDLARDVAGALDWWREAGVDLRFADTAQPWVKPPEPEAAPEVQAPPPPPAPPPVPQIGSDRAAWPQDLAGIADWWLAEPSLDGGQLTGRIAPRGPAGAPLMVLVEHPEAEDRERLLSGPQGQLVDAILAALGIATDAAYVASAIPRHMPIPDWAALGAAGLGEIAHHHIRLAAPQRLIVFGSHVSSLLGHDPANSSGFLHNIQHEGAKLPILAAPGLDTLLRRPRGKARLWQALLEWTGTNAT
jgi:DNA polymerase